MTQVNSKKKASLSSLLKVANSGSALNAKLINTTQIDFDPNQPRKAFTLENLTELAESLLAIGQIQPIVVRENPDVKDRYILVVGERRFRANILNKAETIRSLIQAEIPVDKLRLIQIAENLNREALSSSDLVSAVFDLHDNHKLTAKNIGLAIGCSKSRVSELMTVATAPDFIKQYLTDGAKLRPVVELARLHKLDAEYIESHLENKDVKDITLPFINSLKSQLEQSDDADSNDEKESVVTNDSESGVNTDLNTNNDSESGVNTDLNTNKDSES
ncbi:MAG: ParB/RepB/Spo0J family partition protein, partial [Cocleimonas sp.]